ncbi:hypothetical protein GCM10012286_18700 [Streptomyces lasiicapitis]|uniref:Uncharacterized protein n=1 Tax=Streptomyces lasiicapitis TaxID=1923961 RepID=A0ABQ2LMT8_9ACTN|nr:hypothetical protein GCM10012286_18700 [Streptomyces lasiicapitis]
MPSVFHTASGPSTPNRMSMTITRQVSDLRRVATGGGRGRQGAAGETDSGSAVKRHRTGSAHPHGGDHKQLGTPPGSTAPTGGPP